MLLVIESMAANHLGAKHTATTARTEWKIMNDTKGLAGMVNLKKRGCAIFYEENVADELIKARAEKIGYKATEIWK